MHIMLEPGVAAGKHVATPGPTVQPVGLLSSLIDAVAGVADLEQIYERALDGLEAGIGIERSAVLLLDDQGVARFVAWRGLSDDYRGKAEGHFPWPVDASDPPPLAVPDVLQDTSLVALYDNFRREGIRAVAFIPLVYHRRLLGKFMLYHAAPHDFSTDELALSCTIGRLIAFAVERTKVEQTMRELDRRKDEFLATLAHELRNPLAALSAGLDLVPVASGAAGEREHEVARRQVRYLARMVDDLLDLSRLSRGLVELRPEVIELSSIVARSVEIVRPLLDRMEHDLVLSVPARQLIADPMRLEQILTNLLTNAAKYTPPRGKIELSGQAEGERIVLRVRDNGIGMPAELLPRVFDLFTQGERTLDRSQGGLGIGLTITKQLVDRHGGTITVTSEPNRGSEFVISLPLGGRTGRPTPRTEVVPGTRPLPLERIDRPARVLLVDDNLDMVAALAEVIRSWGHTVEVQTTSATALASLAESRPDFVILDIGLPVTDGYELARQIHAQPALADLPLIAISGYGQAEDLRRSREAGFAAHLVKPIDTKALRRLLSRPPRTVTEAFGDKGLRTS